MSRRTILPVCLVLLAASAFAGLCVGRYPLPAAQVLQALAHRLGLAPPPADATGEVILFAERTPRVIAAMLIGAGLSLSGASYQSVFRNPLVSPSLLGVLAGAGFGAAVAVVTGAPAELRLLLTFAGGAAAVVVGVVVARAFGRDGRGVGDPGILLLVFGGLVSTALFTALLSIMKFAADPENQLPDIVFWLLGSLAAVQPHELWRVGPVLAAGGVVLLFLSRYLDALALSDDEARSLGLPVGGLRLAVIAAATVTSALTVALAGVIGWVGLIVPHVARLLVGPTHRRLMPVAACIGAVFMIVSDGLARTLTASEIPLGVVSDLLGVVIFLMVLPRIRRGWV
jgi:iron complex transport system permease protein